MAELRANFNKSNIGTSAGGLVWDAHVHSFAPEMQVEPGEWARRHGERHWWELMQSPLQTWVDLDTMLRRMDVDGVAKAVLLGWYWETVDSTRRHNDWMARVLERYPERFLAFAAYHPGMPDAVAFVAEAAQWGACGVGECLPQVQNTGLGAMAADPWSMGGWQDLIAATTARGWPINVHVTEPVGRRYRGRVETPLQGLVDLFAAHPQQKWIAAHWGGGLPFYTANPVVAAALRNVWVDTAASPLIYVATIWRSVLSCWPVEKILFGSDYPLRLYPRTEQQAGWGQLLKEVGSAISEEEKTGGQDCAAVLAAVLGGNLRALL